ncbi:hypothetical protein [Rufibacter sp. LB8]|uniref:hypothetical protein n=1 Tax=Rufibacter sp. LB8 TaxID=2777781 RepID=UPI00178C3510|nr:hypothetical protein [Rufibacter sp. LB8]
MGLILLVGVLLFVFFYAVGALFLHGKFKKATYTQHVINFWVGLLLAVSLYAILKAVFVTILLLVPGVLVVFRKNLSAFAGNKVQRPWLFMACSAGVYVLVFFLQVNFSMGVFQNPFGYLHYLHPYPGERYIYSAILSFVHYDGAETVSMESALQGVSGISLYHFLEFWLGSLFKSFLNAKSDLVLFYFVYPVFKTFTVLTLFSVFSEKIHSKKALAVVVAVLFCFSAFGFLWITVAVAKLHLRDIIILPMLLLVVQCLYLRRFEAAVALLMVASVEYVLFVPALLLTYLLFFKQIKGRQYFYLVGFLTCYLMVFWLFREKVDNKYFTAGPAEAILSVFTLAKAKEIYRVMALAILMYPIRTVAAYFLLTSYEHVKRKKLVMDVGAWILLVFLAYQVLAALLSDLSLDAWQFKNVSMLLSTVAFVFVLYELLNREMYAICLVVLLLASNYKHPLEPIVVEKGYDLILEKKLAAVGAGKKVVGFFVDEQKGLPEQWALFHYPTHATEYARANDFRTYLFAYDITGIKKSIPSLEPKAHPILQKLIHPLFDTKVGLSENIRQHKVSLVWINKNSNYLPALKNHELLHVEGDYLIYQIRKENL